MNADKIVMIAPVYPFKGGISHYSALMYKALSKKYDVDLMSFKLQYPKFLFKKEQKDYKNDKLKIDGVDFCINTINPFNYISTALKIRKMKPKLVIFQWWHPYFTPCFYTILKLLGKTNVLFICHNVFPHERFPLDRFLTKLVLRNGNYFITHSSMDKDDLISIKKDAEVTVSVLPNFNSFKLGEYDREKARNELDISSDEKVLLFFGFIRKYKGLKYLINALPKCVSEIEKLKLLIVGEFPDENTRQDYFDEIEKNNMKEFIKIYDGYIPDDEVEKFFVASDVVVMPYESATQSGIVQIAYGFEKPVIVTDVGGLPEVVADGVTGYVSKHCDVNSLSENIIKFFDENKASAFSDNIKIEEKKYSWERMVEKIDYVVEEIERKSL